MKTLADGTRFYETGDVNYERVHAAQTAVGRRITEKRIADMRARGRQPCVSLDARTHLQCNSESVGIYLKGPRCVRHTPAAENGRPETVPTCNKPLRCYCDECLTLPDAHAQNERARQQLSRREVEWVNAVKSDVLTLARLATPFTLAELAEHLPPARSVERPVVEQSLLALLAEGADRGLIVKHPNRNEWKGASHG